MRLLTIHAAKGLEFKVVVVADAGRSRRPHRTSSRSRTGASASRSPIPATGTRVSTDLVPGRQGDRDRAEQAERLAPLLRRDDAGDGAADRLGLGRRPERGDERTPIGWVLEPARARGRGARSRRDCAGRGRARVRRRRAPHRPRPAAAASPRAAPSEPEPSPRRRPGSSCSSRERARRCPPPAPRLRELTVVPEPPLHGVTRLSYSAISLFDRCSYRYYAERVAGMRPAAWAPVTATERPAGCIRPRSATPSTACSSSSTSRTSGRARRARRARPGLVSGRQRRRGRARRASRARVLRVGARAAHRRARGRPGGAAFRVRARRRARSTAGSTSSGAPARARSCSTTRRTRSSAVTRPRSSTRSTARSGPSTRSPASAPGAERGRGRLPVSRGARRGRLGDLHGRTTSRRSRRARGVDRAHPGRGLPADAEPVRLLRLPGARPRLRRAGASATRRTAQSRPELTRRAG